MGMVDPKTDPKPAAAHAAWRWSDANKGYAVQLQPASSTRKPHYRYPY
jgi:hypothetical protein